MKTPIIVFAAASFVKLLLVPAYRSTDFEVHRNWLAITHSLPVSEWYYEDTSEWTLDYPPFFAWFEWALSLLAARVDPLIVAVENLNYASESCVLFQRLSVIVCDLTLLYAVIEFSRYRGRRSCDVRNRSHDTLVLSLLILFNYGLIIVDHVHFQYNGFLCGIFLLSLTRILQSRFMEGAFLFAVLLNLKHLFLYIAPAYFVFLLKSYCFSGGRALWNFSLNRFLKLASVVIATFSLSFGPFVYMGQLSQIISRLFPFKRGLCHAYWAPNVWALYSFADKLLAATVGRRIGLVSSNSTSGGGMTSGLVGEMQLQALPEIVPMATAVITLLAMMPALLKLWIVPAAPVQFLKTLLACAYASFLFGWHVHEKAVMIITLPLCLLAVEERKFARIFLILSTAGHVSLFPLLFRPAETPIKLSLFLLYTAFGFSVLPATTLPAPAVPGAQPVQRKTAAAKKPPPLLGAPPPPLLTFMDKSYFVLLFLVQFYCLFLHANFAFLSRYEFLPLLLTSVSCALGVVWSWILFCKAILA